MGVPCCTKMKDSSVAFLEDQLQTTFADIASSRLIIEIDWLENPPRAYAITSEEDDLQIESNLIILFPAFSA